MQESEYYSLAALEETHWWYAGMSAIAAEWLSRLSVTPNAASSRRLLDAGCGTGGALRWLAPFGRPFGFDQHPVALQLAGDKGCSRLVRADVRALPFAGESFSILTSFDVVYQVDFAEGQAVLHEFARVLQPGGWLLLRLPAYNWLRGAHDAAVQTRHRYTCREVRDGLIAAGLEPVRITYANALLFLPAVLWRLTQNWMGVRAASDVRPTPRSLNAALKAVLSMERVWLRYFNFPVGLSVLALARKEIP